MSKHTIQIEPTNNANILKFVSNHQLTKGGSYQFNDANEAKESLIATELFKLPFTSKVFISANFIAIEKFDIVAWDDIKNEIRELVEIYLNDGNEMVNSNAPTKKAAIEVFAESTPNPNVMKFGVNKLLTLNDYEFKDASKTDNAPLAKVLFNFPFVKEVYFSENYISITKNDIVTWEEVLVELRYYIKDYLQSGKTIVNEEIQENLEFVVSNNVDDLIGTAKEIANILEEHVKPAVAADGGNIVFKSYDEDTKDVYVVLQGACSGCPSSKITLKNGIETMLQNMLPNKINQVIAVNG